MNTARYFHTATLLATGKVLIAGGFGQGLRALDSAELYDPSTGTFTSTGAMKAARGLHTATLLADGRVLIAGGRSNQNGTDLASAELYDPSTGTFVATGDMTRPMAGWHTAPLLGNGRVLVAGSGFAAQIYDPLSNTFNSTDLAGGPPPQGFVSTATRLADGRILITGWTGGGVLSDLYDPGTGTFSSSDPHNQDLQTATLLTDGKVLLEGGDCESTNDAELYDPPAGAFSATGSTIVDRRFTSTATLLSDGTVLVAGGDVPGGVSIASAELYDPSVGKFSVAGNLTVSRQTHTATLLPDGTVLIAGGSSPTFTTGTSTAEIFTPKVLKPAPVLFSLPGGAQGAILHGSTQQLVSPDNPAIAGEVLEIYSTGLIEGAVMPPLVSIGGRAAEVLFFGNAPGYAGLNQINARVPDGAPAGSSVSVRLNYLGRPSNEVTIAVH